MISKILSRLNMSLAFSVTSGKSTWLLDFAYSDQI